MPARIVSAIAEQAALKRWRSTEMPDNLQIMLRDFVVPFTRPSLRVAIAQISGGGTEKQLVETKDRQLWNWPATDTTRSRTQKAVSILRWLGANEPSLDLLVFPEYTFPVDSALTELRRLADQYNIVVVAGCDTSSDLENAHSFARCPVLIPGQDPVDVFKRSTSQWEKSQVQEKAVQYVPRFCWEVSGRQYWFMVYVCLDFLTKSVVDAQLTGLKGPGLYVVPAHSPKSTDFGLFAGLNFRTEGGTATIFANASGVGSAGASAIYALNPEVSAYRPALGLPEDREVLALLTLHMDALDSPRVSRLEMSVPVTDSRIRSIGTGPGNTLDLSNEPSAVAPPPTRAVINPALLSETGRSTRVAFLKTESFLEAQSQLQGQPFECLAVLGAHDLIVTHAAHDAKDLDFDIRTTAKLRLRNGHTTSPERDDAQRNVGEGIPIPYFEVLHYLKVLGHAIDSTRDRISELPEPAEIPLLAALAEDYYSNVVQESDRIRFTQKRWILSETHCQPGNISALVAVSLQSRGSELARRLADFERDVIARFIPDPLTLSIYRGFGKDIDCDFLIRVNGTVKDLSHFIRSIHEKSHSIRETIATRTYFVLESWSRLNLSSVLTVNQLPPNLQTRVNRFILPVLKNSDILHMRSLDTSLQMSLIEFMLEIVEDISNSNHINNNGDHSSVTKESVIQSVVEGLLNWYYGYSDERKNYGFDRLYRSFDELRILVEDDLKRIIEQIDLNGSLKRIKEEATIQSNREARQFSWSELIKACIVGAQYETELDERKCEVRSLRTTIEIRNSLQHRKKTEFETRVSITDYCKGMKSLVAYIDRWLK